MRVNIGIKEEEWVEVKAGDKYRTADGIECQVVSDEIVHDKSRVHPSKRPIDLFTVKFLNGPKRGKTWTIDITWVAKEVHRQQHSPQVIYMAIIKKNVINRYIIKLDKHITNRGGVEWRANTKNWKKEGLFSNSQRVLGTSDHDDTYYVSPSKQEVAAFMCGFAAAIWHGKESIKALNPTDFNPYANSSIHGDYIERQFEKKTFKSRHFGGNTDDREYSGDYDDTDYDNQYDEEDIE